MIPIYLLSTLKKLTIILFVCINFALGQTTYYISSSKGNDANTGKSESSSWKTILKVRNTLLKPGDKILFKRGDVWEEGIGLVIKNSGTANSRITVGAYGSGNKPEISLSYKITGSWTNRGSNIWRLTDSNLVSGQRMLWANNKLLKVIGQDNEIYADQSTGVLATTANVTSVSQVKTINSKYRYNIGSGYIDLYSASNPGTVYSKIETFKLAIAAITLTNVDNITVQDIKISKCSGGIYIKGCSNIIIDNVEIYGVSPTGTGIVAARNGSKKTLNLEIKNCTLNGGIGAKDIEDGIAYEYYWGRGHFGINLGNGADYNKIHNNTITGFHHTNGVIMVGNPVREATSSATSNYNEVYDNILDMSWQNFGRAFCICGTKEALHDNRFYRNKIIHQNIQTQIGGYHNYFYYNIIADGSLGGYYKEGERRAWCWTGAFEAISSAEGSISTDNYFFNNTLYDIKGQAVLDFGSRNSMFNNLFVNYNKSGKFNNLNVMQLKGVAGNTIYRNNNFYSSYYSNSSEIAYNAGTWWGSIASWNSQDKNADVIDANTKLSSNPIANASTFSLAVKTSAGIDISSYVPSGFKDRNGNTVNRTSPTIGAIQTSSSSSLALKVFLQSVFNSGKMSTKLSASEKIPLLQPYSPSPWGYEGEENVQRIPPDVVDWVLVELRSDTSFSSTVAKRAAFIRNDGNIVDLDGISPLAFSDLNKDSYYIIVRHRNHLGIMSAEKITFNKLTFFYDFTSSPSKVFGNDLANLGNGKYGMYAGDSDGNGSINTKDYANIGNALFKTGYIAGDVDLNGTVNVSDYNSTSQNLNKTSKIPGESTF